MTWQLTLVIVWVQFALGATAILGVTCLALRWIAQPAERARLILFMLATLLVLPLFSAIAPFPSWRLGLIPHGAVASVPDDAAFHPASVAAGPVAAQHHRGASADVTSTGAQVSEQLEVVNQPIAHDDLHVSGAEPPRALSLPAAAGLDMRSIAGWLALAIILAHAAAAVYLVSQSVIGKMTLRRICRSTTEAPESVRLAWQAIAGSSFRRVRLLISTRVEAPLVFGWLRPTVVIPHEIAAKNDAALTYCLAHEWSHIERWDLLSWRFVNLCQFVLWYQPAFWMLRRELRICQEFLADNRSIRGAAGPLEYSELLLGLAKRRGMHGVAGALTMFDQPSQLARRIKMLLEDHVPLRVRCRRPFTSCVLALSALIAITANVVRIDSSQAEVETAKTVAQTAEEPAEAKPVDPKPAEAKKDEKPAQMVFYTEVTTIEGRPQPLKSKVYIADDGRKRTEMPGTMTNVFDATGQMRITLVELTKRAMVRGARENFPRSQKPFMEWLRDLRKTSGKPVKELGEKELDGKRVTGFVATQLETTYTVWVDYVTGKPVTISAVMGSGAHNTVMSDFRFDEKPDESLFSLDVPAGYKVFQVSATKSEPSGKVKTAATKAADLQPAWSREGQWVAVAAIDGQPAVYGIYHLTSVIKVTEKGEDLATTEIVASAFRICSAKLSGNNDREFLTFTSGPLTAYSSDEKVLWYYSKQYTPGDVCTIDLNLDGIDEVILSNSGYGGVQALDHTGKLLWKNTSFTNVWGVSAGDIEGDGRPEIVAADGTVHIFDADGKQLRALNPGFHAQKVRVWENTDKDKSAAVIIAAGSDASDKTTVAGLNPQGATQWSIDFSARVVNAATCRQKPWLALTFADGGVRVIDVVAGKVIAQVGGQGNRADVAWLPPKEDAPLLVVATGEALHAYRIPAPQP